MYLLYDIDVKPIVRIGENLEIIRSYEPKKVEYYTVEYIESIPNVTYDFGPLNAYGQTVPISYFKEGEKVEDLKPEKNDELLQVRFKILDDVSIKVSYKGKEGNKNVIKKGQSEFDMNTPEHLTELFIMSDIDIYFDIINYNMYPLVHSRVKFYGFKYKLRKLDTKPKEYTSIPLDIV